VCCWVNGILFQRSFGYVLFFLHLVSWYNVVRLTMGCELQEIVSEGQLRVGTYEAIADLLVSGCWCAQGSGFG